MDQDEIYYIEKYNGYTNGYNCTKGGDGGILGYKMTDEQKEKIRRLSKISNVNKKKVYMYNVSKTHHSYILRDIFRFKGLIVGAPTYNNGLYHEMDVLLSEIANRDIKNHAIGWFGSFAWAGKAVQKIEEWNEEKIHFEPVGVPVEMKQSLTPETKQQCEALGKAMAEKLLNEV